jgi:polyvinyl alcohol dehydrogenase (cytochrome)
MYLGDLLHSSYAASATQFNASNVTRMNQLWKVSTNASISAAPTVVGGNLYFGAWDGTFYALDGATGNTLWSTFLGVAPMPSDPTCQPGIGVASQAAVTSDTVYVGGGDSAVYALDRTSGAILWRRQIADPQAGAFLWSSPMISGNALYIGIASLGDCPWVRGAVARIPLDAPGSMLIHYLVPETAGGAGTWSTVAIDEQSGLVYVTTGDSSAQDATQGIWGSALLALDINTLDVRGYFFLPLSPGDVDIDFGSSPTLFQTSDGNAYVAASGKDGVMYVLNRGDLSLAWQFQLAIGCVDPRAGCGALSTPAFDGAVLYAGSGASATPGGPPGFVYAFDPIGRETLWVYPARGVVIAPVTVTPGLVFVPTAAGLVILDAASGAELWSDGGAGALYSQAAVSNGVVYCTYANGDVVALTPAAAQPPRHRVVRR